MKAPKQPTRTSRRRAVDPIDPAGSLVDAFLTNERIHQVLLDLLHPDVWRAPPPCSKRRNIATSFAHVHNVRCMRLRMSGAKAPARLDRAQVTPAQARAALSRSAQAMAKLIEDALDAGGLVPNSPIDVVHVVAAAIAHEAHHRGQICHWARELGQPILPEEQLLLWDWPKRRAEVARSRG